MTTPQQLSANDTEHGHQQAVFAWAAVAKLYGFDEARRWIETGELRNRLAGVGVSDLEWLHAIPSGGSRGDTKRSRMIRGAQMKAEGVRPGIADIFLPVPIVDRSGAMYAGLYIELKRPKKNARSKEQKEFQTYARRVGYQHEFCVGWREAVDKIEAYLRS